MTSRYTDIELKTALSVYMGPTLDQYCPPPELDESIDDFCERTGAWWYDGFEPLPCLRRWLESRFRVAPTLVDVAPWVGPEAIQSVGANDTAVLDQMSRATPNVRGLAEWILDHAPVVNTAPLAIAGTTCDNAGVFLGLRTLAWWTTREPIRIAPSTRIWDVFADARDYDRFLVHAEFNLGCPFRAFRSKTSFSTVAALCNSIAVIWFICHNKFWMLALSVVMGVGTIKDLWKLDVENAKSSSLPSGVETFGDLARLIVRERDEDQRPLAVSAAC